METEEGGTEGRAMEKGEKEEGEGETEWLSVRAGEEGWEVEGEDEREEVDEGEDGDEE
eukprot:evm.model.NODE_30192_length_15016_cov_32.601490.2